MSGKTQWNKVAVVGGGNMGSGIAQKIATEGIPVVLVDLNEDAVAAGLDRIRTTLAEGVERRIFRPEQAEQIQSRVSGAHDLADIEDADLVIEAVFEDLDVKRKLFRDLDKACGPDTILATNTSSFYVQSLAEATKRPDRVVGLHYFYHPAKNRLVEVIPAKETSDATYKRAWALQEMIGKTPIHSEDAPGFVVNRYFVPWLNEAVRLLEEGKGNEATVDAAAKSAFRIGMGPFELMNVTGVPIAFHAATTLGRELGDFYSPARGLAGQVEKGENWSLDGDVDEAGFAEIGDRLLAVTVYVAAKLVEENVGSIEDTDIGARVGLRWAKGPFELANIVGLAKVKGSVDALRAQYDLPPATVLDERAAKNEPFTFEVVTLSVDDGIATVTIRRPDAMNALNEEVVRQLELQFTEAERRDDVRTIVLDGSGKAFVAGADIRYFVKNIKANRLDRIQKFTRAGQDLLKRIDRSKKQIIAKVDGLSLGGGSELALCADEIVVTDRGMFGFPETGIGIYPGLGGTQRTRERIGVAMAKYLIYTGQMLDGKTAVAIGLADHFVPRDQVDVKIRELAANPTPKERAVKSAPAQFAGVTKYLSAHTAMEIFAGKADAGDDAAVQKTAKKIASKAPIALRIAEKLIEGGDGKPLDEGLEMELAHLEEIFSSEDALTGLSSLGRGRPEFKDR